ncbi:MAG: NAD(P)/FAD-dependent oxidoreductase [Candidatus Helarchaeota archaeon]|nr:NAD(P)/FAD-dependent oxidoreductase [Candidatus Helarchaeota archaeon]
MRFDVIICGAGPSGAFCARQLAKNGFKDLLLEAKSLPRYKTGSGWLTQGVFELLGWDPSNVDFPIVSTSKLMFYSKSLEGVEMSYEGKPVTFGASRKWFDYEVVKNAEESGATLVDNSKVKSIKITPDKVTIFTGEKYESQVVVGADGAYSKVALDLGVRKCFDPSEVWLCICSETDLSANKGEEGVAHLVFADFDTGYYWFYPKKDKLNFGIATSLEFIINKAKNENKTNSIVLKELFDNSKTYFKKLDLLDTSVKLEPRRAHFNPSLYNLNSKKYRVCGNRFVLVGDAIGASNPLSGEGIFQGIRTAKIAAEEIDEAIISEDYYFKNYEAKVLAALGREHKFSENTQKMLKPSRPDFDAFFNILRSSKKLRKSILEALYGLDRRKKETKL